MSLSFFVFNALPADARNCVTVSDSWPAEEYKDIDSSNFLKWFETHAPGGDDPEKFEAAKKKVNRIARDNARTPVQWSSGHEAGFTTGKPWMRVNDNYTEVNVEDEEKDSESVLHFWRKCIETRKQHPQLFGRGDFVDLDFENPHTISYIKKSREKGSTQQAYVVCNFSQTQQAINVPDELKDKKLEILLATEPSNASKDKLNAYEGRVYLSQ